MTNILVVDDEELVRVTLCQMLEQAGYEVIEAANGNQALRVFQEQEVDLVVTDIFMPEKEGIETIRELRKLRPDIKIIAISGGGRTGDLDYLELAKDLGAKRALTKPFKREEVLSAVTATLEQAD
jgi:CheY-like chemotaxis protein